MPRLSRTTKNPNSRKFPHSSKELAQPFIADASDDHLAESHDGHDAQPSHDVMATEKSRAVIAKSDEHRDKNNTADNSTRPETQTHASKYDEECDKDNEESTSIVGRRKGTKFSLIFRLCLAIVAHSFTVSGALLVINMISKLVAVREISSDPNMAHVIGALALSSDAAARIIAGIISFRLALRLMLM